MPELLYELQQAIRERRVLVITGAGVSIDATHGDPRASWVGLLKDGVERCIERDPALANDWATNVRSAIDGGHLIAAADAVVAHLGGLSHGEFRAWLAASIGQLTPVKPSAIRALAILGIPIATTNYDGLIESLTGLSTILWNADSSTLRDWICGHDTILHLHGFWRDPQSIIMSQRSYDRIQHRQTLRQAIRSLAFQYSFLLVGFGQGLADPHFTSIRDWIRKYYHGSGYAHYRLVPLAEHDSAAALHLKEDDRIRVLAFSSDLGEYLASLDVSNLGFRFSEPLEIQPAAAGDMARIYELDRLAFRPDDLIAPEIFATWWKKNNRIFWVIRQARAAPISGYYAILFLKQEVLDAFKRGEIREDQLETSNICTEFEALKQPDCYVFSVVAPGSAGLRLQVVNNLIKRLRFFVNEGKLRAAYATGATQQGINLLDRLVSMRIADRVQSGERRADRHPLYRIKLNERVFQMINDEMAKVER